MDADRYSDLTDEIEQMHSGERALERTAVIVCGAYMAHIISEMVRYLVTKN